MLVQKKQHSKKKFYSLFELLKTTKKPYHQAILKHQDYYYHHLEIILTAIIKKRNSIYHFENLTVVNQNKYLENNKNIVPTNFWLYDNPIDYDKKLHRNNNFFYNFVQKYDLHYLGVHRIIELLKEFNICTVKKGRKYSTTPTATTLQLNDPKYWMIPENTSFQDYEKIILPALKYSDDKKRHNVLIKDKSRRADGSILPLRSSRSNKPIDCTNNWTKRGSSEQVALLNYINGGIPNKEFHYTRIFKNDQKTGGRFHGLYNQITRRTRQELIKRFNLVELDYKSNNPNIIYQITTGSKYNGDMYIDTVRELSTKYPELKEYEKEYRKVIKSLQILVLGANSRDQARGSIVDSLQKIGIMNRKNQSYHTANKHWQDFLSDNFFNPSIKKIYIHPNDILEAIEKVFAEIKDYLYHELNNKLQYIESEMQRMLLVQMRKDNILPIGIHDAILIPEKWKKKYELIKEEIFVKACEKNKQQINFKTFKHINKQIRNHTDKQKNIKKNIRKRIEIHRINKRKHSSYSLYCRLFFLQLCNKVYQFP